MLAVTDTAIAAQNAVVAAESFGIGSCYIGDIMENCDTQRSLLHLPDYVFPAVMLVFGWPTQQQKDRPKPQRCAMEHIVHENGYRTMDGAELRENLVWGPPTPPWRGGGIKKKKEGGAPPPRSFLLFIYALRGCGGGSRPRVFGSRRGTPPPGRCRRGRRKSPG